MVLVMIPERRRIKSNWNSYDLLNKIYISIVFGESQKICENKAMKKIQTVFPCKFAVSKSSLLGIVIKYQTVYTCTNLLQSLPIEYDGGHFQKNWTTIKGKKRENMFYDLK